MTISRRSRDNLDRSYLGSLSSGLSSRLRGRLGRGLSRGLDTRLLLSELHGARGT
jgi:hypothetical protein